MKRLFSSLICAATMLAALPAWADKIAVFKFTSPNNTSPPELDAARQWTIGAVQKTNNTFATPDEMVQANAAVRDGVPDTSSEYIAAGNAVQAQWTLAGHVTRDDLPPSVLPDGTSESGYTLYQIELEACQVATGRVESLSRYVENGAVDDIAEMLALLIRPEGIANADIPWEHAGAQRPHPKPKPAPPPPPVTEPPPPPSSVEPRKIYGISAPVYAGGTFGVSSVIASPSKTRGSSTAAPLGVALGYAFPESAPGLELRGYFNGNVAGPSAITFTGGARYALAPFRNTAFFVGPEANIGVFIAEGADKTARFYAEGSVFAAVEAFELFQFEIAGNVGVAAGGSGTLGLAGATFRVGVRF